MTLVVARRVGDTARIVGDTLVTGGKQDLRQRDLALKILALNHETMVAYAGSPEIAHRIVGQIARSADAKHVEGVAAKLAREQGSGADMEFIAVQGGRIFEIKNTQVSGDLGSAWIGDHRAFTKFQEYSAGVEKMAPPHESLASAGKLRMVMEQVAQNGQIESVGGPVVSATSTSEHAKYDPIMSLTSPKYIPKAGDWFAVDFGNAARGGFGFTTITPPVAGTCGWGLFYFQAFRGFYFSARLAEQAFDLFRCSARTAQGFCEALESKLGYRPEFVGQLG